MKLLTYDTGAGPRCGKLQGNEVLDVTALLGESAPLRDVQALMQLPGGCIAGARYLEPGDRVEITVEGIGTLRSTLGPKPALPSGYGYAAPADVRY